ncbi:MAG: hypothetical protein ACP5O7_03230 [Phycisphaerae bacterium]
MLNLSVRRRHEQSYEQLRQSMLDETSRFIEWGMRHPQAIPRIPTHPVGHGSFPEQLKAWFWRWIWRQDMDAPE